MAEAGAAAGGGAGEEHVPDVRFLVVPKKAVSNRSEKWIDGNKNSPFNKDFTLAEKEALFIKFLLKRYHFTKDELKTVYQTSNDLRRQHPDIIALNEHADVLSTANGRMRRHAYFLMIMLKSHSQGSKSSKVQVPHRYRDKGQLMGDLNALKEGIKQLFEQIIATCAEVIDAGGIPVKIPDVFKKPLVLPKPK